MDPTVEPTEAELAVLPETGTGALRLDLARRLTAEALGSAFLLIAVVGSGIMASELSTDVGLQLLENAAATGGALIGLILMFGAPHFGLPHRAGVRRTSPQTWHSIRSVFLW